MELIKFDIAMKIIKEQKEIIDNQAIIEEISKKLEEAKKEKKRLINFVVGNRKM